MKSTPSSTASAKRWPRAWVQLWRALASPRDTSAACQSPTRRPPRLKTDYLKGPVLRDSREHEPQQRSLPLLQRVSEPGQCNNKVPGGCLPCSAYRRDRLLSQDRVHHYRDGRKRWSWKQPDWRWRCLQGTWRDSAARTKELLFGE